MKYGIKIMTFLLFALLLFSACRAEELPAESASDVGKEPSESDVKSVPTETEPQSNRELFDLLIRSWQAGTHAKLYRYASSELAELLDADGFSKLFDSISEPAGELQEVQELSVSTEDDMDVYHATLSFTYATVELQLSLSDVQICGWVRDICFRDVHEVTKNGITQRFFMLKSGEYELNAVYTYVDSAAPCPAVLLIPGSGPTDYNETIGLLTPLEDIAIGLAEQKINSLRIDKRTFRYGDSLGATDGIAEEYLIDQRAALSYLKDQSETGSVYVLGHSFGGQIAAVLAAEDREIRGMVLFNSTARHLADVACDQFRAADPANRLLYEAYAEEAKNAAAETATGKRCYYGVSDAYWAAYNALGVQATLNAAALPTLVVNSTYDQQAFAEDLRLWEVLYADKPNVKLCIYEDISHFGYKIDPMDPSVFYTTQQFPEELLAEFAAFFLMHP